MATVAESQSPDDLLALVRLWKEDRFLGDEAIFGRLVDWKTKHFLWTWVINLRDQVTRRRLELYRRFAADLVKRYGLVYLERFDLRRVSRRPPPRSRGHSKYAEVRSHGGFWHFAHAIENACRRTGASCSTHKAQE